MKIKKLLALLLCLCLVLPLCSAAFATGNDGEPAAAAATATPATDPAEPAAATPTPENPADPAATPAPAADLETPAADPTEAPTCNCGAEGDAAHAETCPLYVAPAASTATPAAPADPTPAATCTCDATEEQKAAEGFVHAEGCPLYVDTTAQDAAAFYDAIMDCSSIDEVRALFDGMTEDEFNTLYTALTEEQQTALREHIIALTPAPEPPKTVTFTDAGPFMPAVNVQAVRRMLRALAAEPEENGLILSKVATPNGNGGYTITMEAYTTGTVTSSTKTVPVDIVLVLDQSGSMAYDFNGNSTDTNANRRQYAMKQAVSTFISAVAEKYTADADHRMAIVTYGSSASTLQGWTYVNAAGKSTLTGKINGLPDRPSGATNVAAGMNSAANLMGSGYNYTGTNTKRQKVVIVFTDGVPTTSTDFNTGVANGAIKSAKTLKDNGVTVYSVGIFNGANPNQLYGTASDFDRGSDGTVGSNWAEFSIWGLGDVRNIDMPAGNRFLNYLSSNYSDATEIGLKPYSRTIFGIGYTGWEITANFNRTKTGYYLTASNASGLSNIFQTISENIQTPTIDLGSETVVKDIISPYFTIPANTTDIKLYTEDYTGTAFDGTRDTLSGASVDIQGDTVSVTGFDFSENFVSNTAKPDGTFGKRLIIEFTVAAKEGFLGGNGVATNGEDSGVYDKDGNPVEKFVVPTVDVPLATVAVTAADKDVYLLGSLSGDDLRSGAAVTATKDGKTYTIDMSKADNTEEPYGLAPWQTEYVSFDLTADPAAGYTGLTDDKTFTLTATIKPTNETGTQSANSANDTGDVHVYKPELTAADSTIYLGQTADYADNFDEENGIVWKHGTTVADTTTMGPAPVLTVGYNPTADAFTQDTDVKMTTAIGESDVTAHTTFINTTDDHDNSTDKHQFTVFVKTCSLTVTKAGSGSMTNGTETHIFTVTGPNGISLKIAVQGNGSKTIVGLPVGEYAVTEDTNWSWRYADGKTGSATLEASETGAHKTVTITNANPTTKWLSGDNFKVNTFAASAQQSAAAPMTELKVAGAAPAILPDGTVQLGINE